MAEFEPKSRNEALLNAIANGQESTIVPQSRNEFLLSEISKKQVPEFTPHTRIEVLLMEVARTVAEGGGGNPNRVEAITGTLAEPFGEHSIAELIEAVSQNNATVKMSVSMGQSTGVLIFNTNAALNSLYSAICEFTVSGSTGTVSTGVSLVYTLEHGITIADVLMSGQYMNLVPQAAYMQTETTIIWHPLPEE